MSRSLNKVTLIGNLGADPEVRSTTGGNRVATFSLATSRSWSGPSGDKQEKTEWHRCVVWNSKASTLADIVERYLKKGDKVYVEGRIEYRQWQDKENQTRYTTEINVRELIMLSGKAGGSDSFEGDSAGGSRVATFSLATSRSWNNPSGEKQEKTEWHRCVVWNTKGSQLADIVEKYVKKGDKLYV
ncbi:MAG: single-stranded DNA-binding protein, partial [Gemmatimonadaceae bacterium]|nr:single-stranded DNA-binding protein [Gemmatimonadaceae bacterium]